MFASMCCVYNVCVIEFIKTHYVNQMLWSPQSPDFNPAEHQKEITVKPKLYVQ